MQLYHLKSCDTCRKARKTLADRDPELIEIRETPVPVEVLAEWLEKVGADVLLNRKSTTWRGLSDAERAGEPLDLLTAHPTLMKRPVIVDGDAVYVGWAPAVRASLGLE